MVVIKERKKRTLMLFTEISSDFRKGSLTWRCIWLDPFVVSDRIALWFMITRCHQITGIQQ
jgi:hypothetical protein